MPKGIRTRLVQLPEGAGPGQLWTVAEAARVTGIPQRTLRTWLARRRELGLTAYRIGKVGRRGEGRIFFQAGELLRWIDRMAAPV